MHELYLAVQREHRELAGPRLRRGATLTENLRVVLHAGINVMAPYQEFDSSFLAVALPRTSRNSPFSADSTDARQQAISSMREVVTISRGRPSGALTDGCRVDDAKIFTTGEPGLLTPGRGSPRARRRVVASADLHL